MRVLENIQGEPFSETSIAIGNFDGVHRGHQALFARAVELAKASAATTVALTFDPHPARFFSPELAPPLITPRKKKIQLIGACGIDTLVIERFDKRLAEMSAEDFVRCVLVETLHAKHIVVGEGFVFGRDRRGNVQTLQMLGARFGFETCPLAAVRIDGLVCSSSKIREFVLMGRLAGANALLGRAFSVAGRVVTGAQRGRTIGVPTANLDTDQELLPGRGVYAGYVTLAGRDPLAAVVNIGTAPTVRQDEHHTIEAHILDFDDQIVGEEIEVLFASRLRDERRFQSLDELVSAIRSDIDRARQLLGTRH
ncbi:MAG: bifunctional riboflavin kinase/FAD synthetase [Deltaproteobacteria bacterium]|nr:bifunctional riboflavin kinase/FAD synthetase [Deltaproteobacteria bacterium]